MLYCARLHTCTVQRWWPLQACSWAPVSGLCPRLSLIHWLVLCGAGALRGGSPAAPRCPPPASSSSSTTRPGPPSSGPSSVSCTRLPPPCSRRSSWWMMPVRQVCGITNTFGIMQNLNTAVQNWPWRLVLFETFTGFEALIKRFFQIYRPKCRVQNAIESFFFFFFCILSTTGQITSCTVVMWFTPLDGSTC